MCSDTFCVGVLHSVGASVGPHLYSFCQTAASFNPAGRSLFEALRVIREVLEKRADYPALDAVSGLPERWKVRYTAPFSRDPAAVCPGAIRDQQAEWRKLSLMPIYEYRCSQCGNQLEALQKISDAPLTQCPACNQNGLVKQVSASSFRLKGGGWYETDFKTGKRRHGTQDSDSGSTPATSSATAS